MGVTKLTALILLAPYLAILIYAWDRRSTEMGIVVCLTLAVIEVIVGAHLWLAFA